MREENQLNIGINRWCGAVCPLDYRGRVGESETFIDEGRNFQIEVTSVTDTETDAGWELTMEITFLSTGVLALLEPN
jgi:hypothetical protein